MIPLIQIRLFKVKRNFCQNLMQFLYPPLFMIILVILYVILTELNMLSGRATQASYDEIKHDFFSFYNEIDKNLTTAIICKDDNLASEFLNFSRFRATVFSSYEEMNETNFERIIIIEGDIKEKIQYKVKANSFRFFSIEETANTLDITEYDQRNFSQMQYQSLISNFNLHLSHQEIKNKIHVSLRPFTCLREINLLSESPYFYILAAFVSITYSSSLFSTLTWMVSEKEKRLTIYLYRQGITQTIYFFSWIFTYVILTIVPLLLITLLLKIFFIRNANFFLLFFFQLLYSLNLFSMAFFIHSFVDKVQTGNTIIKVLFIGMGTFSIVLMGTDVSLRTKLIFSIFPQVTQAYNCATFLKLDNIPSSID